MAVNVDKTSFVVGRAVTFLRRRKHRIVFSRNAPRGGFITSSESVGHLWRFTNGPRVYEKL